MKGKEVQFLEKNAIVKFAGDHYDENDVSFKFGEKKLHEMESHEPLLTVARPVEKDMVMQSGFKLEPDDDKSERRGNSFAMTANVVKKFEDSGSFPRQARGMGRIIGL